MTDSPNFSGKREQAPSGAQVDLGNELIPTEPVLPPPDLNTEVTGEGINGAATVTQEESAISQVPSEKQVQPIPATTETKPQPTEVGQGEKTGRAQQIFDNEVSGVAGFAQTIESVSDIQES